MWNWVNKILAINNFIIFTTGQPHFHVLHPARNERRLWRCKESLATALPRGIDSPLSNSQRLFWRVEQRRWFRTIRENGYLTANDIGCRRQGEATTYKVPPGYLEFCWMVCLPRRFWWCGVWRIIDGLKMRCRSAQHEEEQFNWNLSSKRIIVVDDHHDEGVCVRTCVRACV